MLYISGHTPPMLGTIHRKIIILALLVFVLYGFFKIVTDKMVTDKHTKIISPAPPVARNNRGRMLQTLWLPPTMMGTLHRKKLAS